MFAGVIKELNKSRNDKFEHKVYTRIEEENDKRQRERLTIDTPIRVSSLASMCPRDEVHYALTFDRVEYKKIAAKSTITFLFGDTFQKLLRDEILGPQGVLIGEWNCQNCDPNGERPIRGDNGERIGMPIIPCTKCGKTAWTYHEEEFLDKAYGIKGHNDGIIWNQIDYRVLEIKTCADYYFKEFRDRPHTSPFIEKYLIQLQLYMYLTRIYKGLFWFFNKNTSDSCSLEIEYMPDVVERALNKANEIRKGIHNKTLPVCTCPDKKHENLKLY